MNPWHDDERISGYLDGELTADEQASFEEELAQNAELRQVVDELRSLRSDLDMLPRARLEDDFAARVLRRAEREMLSGGNATSAAAEPPSVKEIASSPSTRNTMPSRWSRQRWARPLLWSAATIAAAVLITALTRDHDHGDRNQVAQVHEKANLHGPMPESKLSAPANQVAKDSQFNGGVGDSGGFGGDRQLGFKKQQLETARDVSITAGWPLADSDAPSSAQARSPGQHGAPDLKSLAVEDQINPETHVAGQLRADKAVPAPMYAATKPAARDGEKVADNREKRDNRDGSHMLFRRETAKGAVAANGVRSGEGINARPAGGALADDAQSLNGPAPPPAEPAAPAPDAGSQAKAKLAESEANSKNLAEKGESNLSERIARRSYGLAQNRADAANPVLVAQCVATPDAANDRFERILRERGIQWRAGVFAESLDEKKQLSPSRSRQMNEEQKSDTPAKPQEKYADASGGPAKSSPDHGESAAAEASKRETLGRQQDAKVFVVEASSEQIQALIGDLQSQPSVYQQLTVSAAGSQPLYRGISHDGAAATDAEMDVLKAADDEMRRGGEGRQAGSPLADQPAAPAAAPETPPAVDAKAADKIALRKQDEVVVDPATRGVDASKPSDAGSGAGQGGKAAPPAEIAPKSGVLTAEAPAGPSAKLDTNQPPSGSPQVSGGFAPAPVNGPATAPGFGAAAGGKKPAEQAFSGDKQTPARSLESKPTNADGDRSDKPAGSAAPKPALQLQSDRAKELAATAKLGAKAPPARMQAVFVFRLAPASAAAALAAPAAPASAPAASPAPAASKP